QQPINCMVRTVFALTPHFVVENAVLVRFYVLAALEVERQEHRCPLSARPTDEMVIVIFLEHGCIPLCHRRNVKVAPPGAELASLQSRAPCWYVRSASNPPRLRATRQRFLSTRSKYPIPSCARF